MSNPKQTTTILIDKEVYQELQSRKRFGKRDSFNSVLRRLLGLDETDN